MNNSIDKHFTGRFGQLLAWHNSSVWQRFFNEIEKRVDEMNFIDTLGNYRARAITRYYYIYITV